MELEAWSGDWGLPSIDSECLKILAFAKFSGAPLTQKSTNNPFWTPAGDLPVLRHAGVVLTDFNSIARHLRACNYSADYNLPPKQVAEASAFIQLMDEKLAPALRYLLWIDPKNQVEMTRPWFGAHLPFPLGLYYPNKFEAAAVNLIESLHGHGSLDIGPDTVVETAVYKAAEECLTLLSHRLDDNHFMFGKSPSSVDAVMYAYLAPLLKAPMPSNTLQNYLKNCNNLVKFVVRVSQNYFPKVVKAWDESQQNQNSKKASEEGRMENHGGTVDEWPNKRRDQIVAGCVASGAMLGYAYSSGLLDIIRNVEVRVVEDDEEEEDDY